MKRRKKELFPWKSDEQTRACAIADWELEHFPGGAEALGREIGCPAQVAWEIYANIRYISGRKIPKSKR